MSNQYGLTVGDLEPPLEVTVTDGVATFDLAESWLIEVKMQDGTLITDEDPTVTVAEDGLSAVLAHEWVDGETDTAGRCYVKAKAFWPDTERPQTFPPRSSLSFDIKADLA